MSAATLGRKATLTTPKYYTLLNMQQAYMKLMYVPGHGTELSFVSS